MSPKATLFTFEGYSYSAKTRVAAFRYRIDFRSNKPLRFTERIHFPAGAQKLSKAQRDTIFNPLLLALGLSYYKLYLPKRIAIEAFSLNKAQAEFWNTLYRKGLGELLYVNKLAFERVAKFPFAKSAAAHPVAFEPKDRSLLGIGGGKDSIVAAELLKEDGRSFTGFIVETQRKDEIARNVAKLAAPKTLVLKRELDRKIFAEHPGSFNGHIPISAIFAFLGTATAALYGYKEIIVANEHSSNFGNLRYKGEEINHQWSKSVEFEELAQSYIQRFVSPDLLYVSLLRQFYELRIAALFSTRKKYFKYFSSCNRNFKVNKERQECLWCGECPKCAFTFLLLSAFLPKKDVVSIFDKNLLADEALLPLFADVLGFGKVKPFDCVGTFDEAQAALCLAARNFSKDVVAKKFLPKVKKPAVLLAESMRVQSAPTLPAPYKLLGIDSVGIVGYGVEGAATEKYLKARYPKIKTGVLDQARDKNYLKHLSEFDLLIKSPGVTKQLLEGSAYTTASNLFFAENKNLTIGVTGTKGKSTVASLVAAMLKEGGMKVELLGNIGSPMLLSLLKKQPSDKIFVLELSSYMLDDIQYSPDLALLLNKFPDHLTYHGSKEAYFEAKERIFAFQPDDSLAFRPPHKDGLKFNLADTNLIGAHNQGNVLAAARVARTLGVSDADMRRALKRFQPLPHRLSFVGEFRGIRFFDDAISTTPESTIAALKALRAVDTIFLGGTDRGYDFKELEKTLRRMKVRNVVLFPDSGKRILKSRKALNVLSTRSMAKAVAFAYKHTAPGKICLLSTASPSYSLWKNFIEKGEEFSSEVKGQA